MRGTIRLATRASPLALWQAAFVARALRAAWPGLRTVLVPVVAGGDADLVTPLYRLGSVGIFCREVHAAVLAGQADAGVHSCKDLPTMPPAGILLAALLRRHDPRDALVGAPSLADLPTGAVVGTSSLRRQHQLAALRPDLRFVPIRGNVQTRLGKVGGDVAATLLAQAGLHRLGLGLRGAPLDPVQVLIPAPAQGALAVDCRVDDRRTRRWLEPLHHRATATAVGIERAVLAGLSGGCSLPLGAYARRSGDGWRIDLALGTAAGLRRASLHGPAWTLAARALAALSAP
jgi:hydroxymethylbilane synthase